MPKSLKEILAGVKKSTVVSGSTGTKPGVDYMPKAKDEQDFVTQHKTEKHEDRVGNGDDVYKATNVKYALEDDEDHGHKSPKDKKVYDRGKTVTEEKKAKSLRSIVKKTNEQSAPVEGGIDYSSGLVRKTLPSYSVDVNTGRNV